MLKTNAGFVGIVWLGVAILTVISGGDPKLVAFDIILGNIWLAASWISRNR